MRYAVLLVILCLALVTLVGRAQETTAPDQAFFEKSIGKLLKVEPSPLTGEALEKVFGAKFYQVKVSLKDGSSMMLVAARAGESLSEVSLPGTTADLPELKALVKPDFKLKADADGKAFEAALDLLYPPDTRYDEKRKAIRHAGTQWTFIRGEFIDNFKGLVVATDADGTITSIKYSREIKK
jgi:hypothetical protein